MSYVGQCKVTITKEEQRRYQEVLKRLECVMDKYEDNNEVTCLLDYIKNGPRHRVTKRLPMQNIKRLLGRAERSKYAR